MSSGRDGPSSPDGSPNSSPFKRDSGEVQAQNVLKQSDPIGKLTTLLNQLELKQKEIQKIEQDHLERARTLLTAEMDKPAAFEELQESKKYKEQLAKIAKAIDAAKFQLFQLNLLSRTLGAGETNKLVASLPSDSPSPRSKESPASRSREQLRLGDFSPPRPRDDRDDSTSSSSDSSTEDDDDERNASSSLRSKEFPPSLQEGGGSTPHIDHEEQKLLSALAREPKGKSSDFPTVRAPASNKRDDDGRNLEELFDQEAPTTSASAKKMGGSKEFHRLQSAAAARKLLEDPVSDDEDSDTDLDNYIKKWKRSRDEDIVNVLRSLRKENTLLKTKLKKERLRIGIELRRVTAANKVLEDQNAAMQELLVRAKQEIQAARNGQ